MAVTVAFASVSCALLLLGAAHLIGGSPPCPLRKWCAKRPRAQTCHVAEVARTCADAARPRDAAKVFIGPSPLYLGEISVISRRYLGRARDAAKVFIGPSPLYLG